MPNEYDNKVMEIKKKWQSKMAQHWIDIADEDLEVGEEDVGENKTKKIVDSANNNVDNDCGEAYVLIANCAKWIAVSNKILSGNDYSNDELIKSMIKTMGNIEVVILQATSAAELALNESEETIKGLYSKLNKRISQAEELRRRLDNGEASYDKDGYELLSLELQVIGYERKIDELSNKILAEKQAIDSSKSNIDKMMPVGSKMRIAAETTVNIIKEINLLENKINTYEKIWELINCKASNNPDLSSEVKAINIKLENELKKVQTKDRKSAAALNKYKTAIDLYSEACKLGEKIGIVAKVAGVKGEAIVWTKLLVSAKKQNLVSLVQENQSAISEAYKTMGDIKNKAKKIISSDSNQNTIADNIAKDIDACINLMKVDDKRFGEKASDGFEYGLMIAKNKIVSKLIDLKSNIINFFTKENVEKSVIKNNVRKIIDCICDVQQSIKNLYKTCKEFKVKLYGTVGSDSNKSNTVFGLAPFWARHAKSNDKLKIRI